MHPQSHNVPKVHRRLAPTRSILAMSQKDLKSVGSSPGGHYEYITRVLLVAAHHIRGWDFKLAEEQLQLAVSLCEGKGDPKALLTVHKKIAKMWMRVHSIQRALPHLKQVKSYAEQTHNFLQKMKAYRDLGLCYQLVRKYETALTYFKKLLELAWYHENVEMELSAYDCIGKQYYYLGNMDKAMYYNERAWKGAVEKKNSPSRVLACNAYEARRKPKVRLIGEHTLAESQSANSSDLSASELPSPTTVSALNASTQLPPLHAHKASEQSPDAPPSEGSSFVIMSHLSLNRSLKNFQVLKDARKVRVRVSRLRNVF